MAASPVALDTSGLLALLNRSDELHGLALRRFELLEEDAAGLIITDWVLAETGNGLARTPARRLLVPTLQKLRESGRLSLVNIDPARVEHSLRRYDARHDKAWGLVDCSTMLIMEELGSVEVFTADRHFEQAGFKALLRGGGSVDMGE